MSADAGVYALTALWRSALASTRQSLSSAAGYLTPGEFHDRALHLTGELEPTEELLRALARDLHQSPDFLTLVVSPWEARRLLGLPADVGACVFNLDGVLIGSAAIHTAAWAETFDHFITARSERTGGRFAPFSPQLDYPRYLHARPRLDGVREFLASRGIRLPEGGPEDPAGTETVHGLAKQKERAFLRRLDEHGIAAYTGSRRYLELAHDAGVRCAVVSASANTSVLLERAGLASLIEQRVDGKTIAAEHLRVKPEPDTLLAACEKLGIDPQNAAAFETSTAGVTAGRRAGFELVIGVDEGEHARALKAEGADTVIGAIAELFDRRLAA